MKRTVKRWAYRWSDTLDIYIFHSRKDAKRMAREYKVVPVTVTYDDGKPAKKKGAKK